jgi:ATP-dependent DNA helicase DinG
VSAETPQATVVPQDGASSGVGAHALMGDVEVEAALQRVTASLPASEDRPAQRRMAAAVAGAIRDQRHLIVQAGTGTGKSLGYLVPALVLGTRVVVATATKALQDQLATRDLPFLAEQLGVPFEFAILKGRSNYLCRQRAEELAGAGDPLATDIGEGVIGQGFIGQGDGPGGRNAGPFAREIRRLLDWGRQAETGDRAELSWEPSAAAWSQVSVAPRDCPGAARCPAGGRCFAEAARDKAVRSDVVVVNTHLYATHLAAGGGILPDHDLLVVDEAHELEDIASASLGFDLTGGRLGALARLARPLVADASVTDAVDGAAGVIGATLVQHRGRRLTLPLDPAVAEALTLTRERLARLQGALRSTGRSQDAGMALGGPAAGEDSGLAARRARAQQAAGNLTTDIDAVLALGDEKVAWVEGPEHAPVLRVAPIDVGASLDRLLWQGDGAPTAVMTSATIPPGLGTRIGLAPGSFDELDVGSPFDYAHQALLYCPLHLPDPRRPEYEPAMIEELVALIEAAGGRTMALFTSWRAMTAAALAVRQRVAWPILTQSDLPKPALVARFSAEEESCLFATMGFWQGVDIPGSALSLVTIDRLPFARPDDPLLQARRDRLGRAAFSSIDVPRAATLLAQGVGRLIRSSSDRGVVAVLDNRLGKASYRWDLVRALPPMRRTRHQAEVTEFLTSLREVKESQ